MRENKYRGRRLDNGEWVIGHLVKMWGEWHILNSDNVNTAYPVEPATIGQYTGLKDKNGKEIYEGDVMRFITEFGETMTSEVAFMNGFFYIQGEEEDDDDIYGITYAVKSMNAEIIGNIHDTPELLKTE